MSVTSVPLSHCPLYFFTVDGPAIADPINPRIKLRVRVGDLVEVQALLLGPGSAARRPHGRPTGTCITPRHNDTHEFLAYLPPDTSRARRYPAAPVHGARNGLDGRRPAANLIRQPDRREEAVPMIAVCRSTAATIRRHQAAPKAGAPAASRSKLHAGELIPRGRKISRRVRRQNRAMAGLSAGGAATYTVGLKHLSCSVRSGCSARQAAAGRLATRYLQLAYRGHQREDQRLLDRLRHGSLTRPPRRSTQN